MVSRSLVGALVGASLALPLAAGATQVQVYVHPQSGHTTISLFDGQIGPRPDTPDGSQAPSRPIPISTDTLATVIATNSALDMDASLPEILKMLTQLLQTNAAQQPVELGLEQFAAAAAETTDDDDALASLLASMREKLDAAAQKELDRIREDARTGQEQKQAQLEEMMKERERRLEEERKRKQQEAEDLQKELRERLEAQRKQLEQQQQQRKEDAERALLAALSSKFDPGAPTSNDTIERILERMREQRQAEIDAMRGPRIAQRPDLPVPGSGPDDSGQSQQPSDAVTDYASEAERDASVSKAADDAREELEEDENPPGDGDGDTPPVDEPPVDEPPVDEPPVDEPPVDEPPVDEPPVDEPPVDEPPVDEPPVDEPPVDDEPTAYTWDDFTNYAAENFTIERPSQALDGTGTGIYTGLLRGGFVTGDLQAVDGTLLMNIEFATGYITGEVAFDGEPGVLMLTDGVLAPDETDFTTYAVGDAFGGEVHGPMHGQLFGPNGEEVGGTWEFSVFGDDIGDQRLEGDFAAKQ